MVFRKLLFNFYYINHDFILLSKEQKISESIKFLIDHNFFDIIFLEGFLRIYRKFY